MIIAGIPNDLFWDLSLDEILAVSERVTERERAANLRAALVAATIANVHRKSGSRVIQPRDFLREPARYMTPEEGARALEAWARRHNATVLPGGEGEQ